jgi:hypothetical protein
VTPAPKPSGRSASFGGGAGVSWWQVHELAGSRLTATAASSIDRRFMSFLFVCIETHLYTDLRGVAKVGGVGTVAETCYG